MKLWFVETLSFTKRIERLGLEDDLRRLQGELLANPEAGDIDPGTGGLRKTRMTASARGKGSEAVRGCTICGYLLMAWCICSSFTVGTTWILWKQHRRSS